MSRTISFTIDGQQVEAEPGQTIMQAADAAGVYIPRLCWAKDLAPGGACRVCTVLVNGRYQSACTQPVGPGIEVISRSEELKELRRSLVEMMFVEGNHYCPFCEKSGNCELQALGYRMGITVPRYPYQFPQRNVDASHPDILVDHNRCILCGRCVRASQQVDGKGVFQFVHRGHLTSVGVGAPGGLGATELAAADRAAEICPVGAIIKKRVGFARPVGERDYDRAPIGSDVESHSPAQAK